MINVSKLILHYKRCATQLVVRSCSSEEYGPQKAQVGMLASVDAGSAETPRSTRLIPTKTASSTGRRPPMPLILQAAANRQLNMHVYTGHLCRLLVYHYKPGEARFDAYACLSALHETTSEEISAYLISRNASVAPLMPDHDMFSSDLDLHGISNYKWDEKYFQADTVRYHMRTCLALRALQNASQTYKDESFCQFVKQKLRPLDKNMSPFIASLKEECPYLRKVQVLELKPL